MRKLIGGREHSVPRAVQAREGESGMDGWKNNFVEKLTSVQSQFSKSFEQLMEVHAGKAFEELSSFLRDNGFRCSVPQREQGRRSFKFELAENAYFLALFRFHGIGEFELRAELFAPGSEPQMKKSIVRMDDVDAAWFEKTFRDGLDWFVERLSGKPAPKPREEFVEV
jgi:hypothetical protein